MRLLWTCPSVVTSVVRMHVLIWTRVASMSPRMQKVSCLCFVRFLLEMGGCSVCIEESDTEACGSVRRLCPAPCDRLSSDKYPGPPASCTSWYLRHPKHRLTVPCKSRVGSITSTYIMHSLSLWKGTISVRGTRVPSARRHSSPSVLRIF